MEKRFRIEKGFTVLEVLAGLALMAIVGLGMANDVIVALKTQKLTELNYALQNLAVSKLEEIAAVNAQDLDASYNTTENNLTSNGLSVFFTRTVTVTTNADGSKTVDVTVASNSSSLSGDVSYNTTFAVWE